MSEPGALAVHGAQAWLDLLAGAVVFLLPGLAAADRWMPGRGRWAWAPLWSFTLLVLAGVVADYVLGLPVGRPQTIALALGLAAWVGRHRVGTAVRILRGRQAPPSWWGRRQAAAALPLLAVLAFVGLVAYLPHMPADPSEPAQPFAALASRSWDALQGRDYPFPVHVDEHNHLAHVAALVRQGTVLYDDPFTGEPEPGQLFTVGGMRGERGFQLGIAQAHLLTGASLPTLFRFLPALWTAYLGLTVYLALRPAPGALAAAALSAAAHTTLRFLGPSFLIPSAFGLPWLLGVLVVATRARGPARLAGLSLLVTGAFFMHLVDGVLALGIGLAAAGLLPMHWTHRAALAATVLLPLLWVWPSAGGDIVAAVTTPIDLPFQPGYFRALGWPLLALAVGGAGVAWHRRDGAAGEARLPHRVLSALAVAMVASITASAALGHSNDATYSRLVHFLFVSLAALAGLGAAAGARALALRLPRPRLRHAAAAGGAAALAALALLSPLQAHLDEPYYRVFGPDSWQAGADFHQAGPPQDSVFLSHPWQAPVYNALTGAVPWTYLLPGLPPVRGEDYGHYVASGGADAAWLQDRGIDYVLGGRAPNAEHEVLAPGVHRLVAP